MYFSGLETCQVHSNQCELIKISSKVIEIGAKVMVGRTIQSEKVNCLIECFGPLTFGYLFGLQTIESLDFTS